MQEHQRQQQAADQTEQPSQRWDHEVDFAIVGSGAGAMTAAVRAHDLGLKTLMLEKSDLLGGSSALSGGGLWIPNNHQMKKHNIEDCDQDAQLYLEAITDGQVAKTKIAAYVQHAKRMILNLEKTTAFKFVSLPKYCDYYLTQPGARVGGRSGETKPFNGFRLGRWRKTLRPPTLQMMVFGKVRTTCLEAYYASRGELRGTLKITALVALWAINFPARLFSRQSTRLTLGNGLLAPLLHGLAKRKVDMWVNTPAKELITNPQGEIIGLIAEKHGQLLRIKTNAGVLMAAGGFERNIAMRKQYQNPLVNEQWTAGHIHNTGDAITMGQAVGARLDFMDDAWWTPTVKAPGEQHAWVLVCEKNMPHSIFVDQKGNRFVNEAGPYIDVVNTMYQHADKTKIDAPCWMIIDSRYRHHFPIGRILPARLVPDHKVTPQYWNTILFKADSLGQLAEKIHIDPQALLNTTERYNEFCLDGRDKDFHRGETLHDNYYSLPKAKPNPNMGTLARPPYYAIRVSPGDLGTKGGLDTNKHGQVFNTQGQLIKGLYACGNCSSPVMGNSYAGAGSTLGPAMLFGFLSAEHASGYNPNQDSDPK